ncbi:MAG: LysR family transcriptional regulator [Gammaproteobacteria bacterium]|nr:LysR family transcriptional regulator [Gammaproteobacteria bacterium]
MRFTLRHLQVFLAVAREQSISRAAAELHMSQSATSSALQELESRYNTQLFDRTGKRLRLNSFGKTIRSRAERLMAHVEEFDRELLNQEDFGHLRVGASLTIGNYLAVKYLAAYLQQHPQAKVELNVSSTPEVVQQVLNFQVDIGLIEAEVHHDDLRLEPWREDNMLIFCSPQHPLAGKKNLSDADLLAADWILREADSGHRVTFDRSMQGLLPDLNIVLELTHNEAIKNAVKAGLGIGCLSSIALVDELEQGVLVPLQAEGRSMHRNFYFVMQRSAAVSQAVDWWLQLCNDEQI